MCGQFAARSSRRRGNLLLGRLDNPAGIFLGGSFDPFLFRGRAGLGGCLHLFDFFAQTAKARFDFGEAAIGVLAGGACFSEGNIAGKFFFENQTTTPATMAKFSTTASQYAPSMLSPVILESSFTEAECLNGVVSSSPDVSLDWLELDWSEVDSLEGEAEAFCADESAGCDSDDCANPNTESRIAAASSNPSFLSLGFLNLA